MNRGHDHHSLLTQNFQGLRQIQILKKKKILTKIFLIPKNSKEKPKKISIDFPDFKQNFSFFFHFNLPKFFKMLKKYFKSISNASKGSFQDRYCPGQHGSHRSLKCFQNYWFKTETPKSLYFNWVIKNDGYSIKLLHTKQN